MARILNAGLEEALARPNSRFKSYGTLKLAVNTGAGIWSYYLATAKLTFDGVIWRPDLREAGEISANLDDTDVGEAGVEIQNVDTVFGKELLAIEEYLSNADAAIGEYIIDVERGNAWHEILLTGLVLGLAPTQQSVQLKIVADVDSGVSVGPFRYVRRRCQAEYKGFECGRPITDPPFCDKTLNGAGGCDGRWGSTNKFIRHMGAPFLDNQVFQKII